MNHRIELIKSDNNLLLDFNNLVKLLNHRSVILDTERIIQILRTRLYQFKLRVSGDDGYLALADILVNKALNQTIRTRIAKLYVFHY